MFSLFSKRSTPMLRLNHSQHVVTLKPKETILLAALRSGIRFPHNCRVGGCASCKCKLVTGKVKELTESAYVLSEDELVQGYILACQSVPKTDIEIEVVLNDAVAKYVPKQIDGLITEQDKLTNDITRLKISLSEPIEYLSGQYAELSIPALCSAVRAYSFAAPANKNQVEFYIRDVYGGELSPLVNSQDLINTKVAINGPFGDFYLRDADVPLVCMACGSGLAPIKALLQQALNDSVNRDVVFYMGARTQQDLYCTDDLLTLANQWQGVFTYIPVLSQEPEDSSWQGQRGLVTDALSQRLTGEEHAYLCGPPLMIDAAIEVLNRHGVKPSHIYFDKFTSKADFIAA